jgi:hypothetical protein
MEIKTTGNLESRSRPKNNKVIIIIIIIIIITNRF